MTGVQLIGKKAVLSAYDELGCDSWALYQGKQFIVGGLGSDVLGKWLTNFEQSGSTATYTLRAYDYQDAPTSSTAGSDYVACLQFKITDQYEGYGIAGHGNKLIERLEKIETSVRELSKPDESDNEGTIGAVITDWFQNPEKLAIVAGIVRQFFPNSLQAPGLPTTQVTPVVPLQKISGFMPVETVSPSSEEGLQRISTALDTLEKRDPNLVVHLEKLAKLAVDDEIIFKSVIGKLDLL